MKKIVFLDFDGVLNSQRYFKSIEDTLTDEDYLTRQSRMLDREAIQRLNGLLAVTGAVVVVSSSWRIGMTQTDLQQLLEEVGFIGTVWGVTPRLNGRVRGLTRGPEIGEWLSMMRTHPEHMNGVRFVILDDDSDMDPYMDWLVQTSNEIGLTDEDCLKAITLLSA